jgi:hypothetical protein
LYWLHYLAKKLFCNKKTKLPGVFDRLLKVNCVKEFLTCDEIKPILGEYIVEENGSDDSLSE